MTSADRNDDLVTAQEKKLEWVTPKISLMGAVDTNGIKVRGYDEGALLYTPLGGGATGGPS